MNLNTASNIIFNKFGMPDCDKSIIQHEVYILSNLGVSLGFGFGIYISGTPYSDDLSCYLDNYSGSDIGKYHLKPNVEDVIDSINELEKEKPTKMNTTYFWQLIATTSYYAKIFDFNFSKIKSELSSNYYCSSISLEKLIDLYI